MVFSEVDNLEGGWVKTVTRISSKPSCPRPRLIAEAGPLFRSKGLGLSSYGSSPNVNQT